MVLTLKQTEIYDEIKKLNDKMDELQNDFQGLHKHLVEKHAVENQILQLTGVVGSILNRMRELEEEYKQLKKVQALKDKK